MKPFDQELSSHTPPTDLDCRSESHLLKSSDDFSLFFQPTFYKKAFTLRPVYLLYVQIPSE
jgi:hypothetical protein